MTLDEKEEKILKLVAARELAREKLNKANLNMGQLIRAEFGVIDARIRTEHKPIYEPLQLAFKKAEEDLQKECE